MRAVCKKNGWLPVPIRDDFKKIYGDYVTTCAAKILALAMGILSIVNERRVFYELYWFSAIYRF